MINNMTRTPIPLEFDKYASHLRQVARDGMYAVYERKRNENGEIHYEVIVIQTHDGKDFGGSSIPPAEVYPSSSAWGTFGWTVRGSESDAIAFMRAKMAERAGAQAVRARVRK